MIGALMANCSGLRSRIGLTNNRNIILSNNVAKTCKIGLAGEKCELQISHMKIPSPCCAVAHSGDCLRSISFHPVWAGLYFLFLTLAFYNALRRKVF